MSKYQMIIGRTEEIDIVGSALGIPAKIDTGAFRSSIHASNIKVVDKDGAKALKFTILGHRCAPIAREIITDRFEKIKVRSSDGEVAERYEVTLKIKIGPKIFSTSFSLADRSANVYPILIGREALKQRFLVDSSKTSISRQKLARQFGLTLDSAEDSED